MATKKVAPKKTAAKKASPKKATPKKATPKKARALDAKQMLNAFDLMADWGAIICTPVDVIDLAEDNHHEISGEQAVELLDAINDDVQRYIDRLLRKQFKKLKLPKVKPAK